jgi:heptaprenylglyceryl phosphate synthase
MRCWLKGRSSTVVSHNRNTTAALARVQLVDSREEVATMENTTKSVAYAAAGSSVIGATSTYLWSGVVATAPVSSRLRGELCPMSGKGLVGQTFDGGTSAETTGMRPQAATAIAAAVITGDADHRSTDRKFAFVKYQPGSRSLRPPA